MRVSKRWVVVGTAAAVAGFAAGNAATGATREIELNDPIAVEEVAGQVAVGDQGDSGDSADSADSPARVSEPKAKPQPPVDDSPASAASADSPASAASADSSASADSDD